MSHDHSPSGPHDHDHEHPTLPDRAEEIGYHQRLGEAVRALLIEKGVLTADEVRRQIEKMDSRSPAIGARVVARAWSDPAFKARLLADGSAACRELGIEMGPTKLVVVENTERVHNMIVCTLCYCYPRFLLGLPPDWYKSRNYRSRAVREPRAVLAEFGTAIPDDLDLRVHDSTADMRYLVLPRRPEGTEGMDEAALAALVGRDAMIGVALVKGQAAAP
jgi:nitrile hydratase subunit alpha